MAVVGRGATPAARRAARRRARRALPVRDRAGTPTHASGVDMEDADRLRDEEDDQDEDDEDGDDDYDFDGGGGDAVDDAAPAVDRPPSRVKRAPCWPPPPQQQQQSSGPVWAPLFRAQSAVPGRAGPAPAPVPSPGPARQPPPPGPRSPPPPRVGPVGPWVATPNPVYGYRMKLFCRTGFHLAIGPKGRVTGTENPNDKYAVMEFSSVTNGEVRIRGVEANLFLAMNRQGKLYGQANIRQEGTVFVEMMLGRYNIYLSRKFAHLGWYVGVKKNGKQKPGHKTAWGQKATQFLPIRVAR